MKRTRLIILLIVFFGAPLKDGFSQDSKFWAKSGIGIFYQPSLWFASPGAILTTEFGYKINETTSLSIEMGIAENSYLWEYTSLNRDHDQKGFVLFQSWKALVSKKYHFKKIGILVSSGPLFLIRRERSPELLYDSFPNGPVTVIQTTGGFDNELGWTFQLLPLIPIKENFSVGIKSEAFIHTASSFIDSFIFMPVISVNL